MKTLMMTATVAVILAVTSIAAAAETNCEGAAARSTPPVPNNPTHIWNVVWRNQRAMCLQKDFEQNSKSSSAGMPLMDKTNVSPLETKDLSSNNKNNGWNPCRRVHLGTRGVHLLF